MKIAFCTVLVILQTFVSVGLGDPQGRSNTCSPDCADCSDVTGICRMCSPGRWGRHCEDRCTSEHCLENTCDMNTGTCTYGCVDGWFPESGDCVRCPSNCERCADSQNCIQCEGSKYGYTCDRDCWDGCASCTHLYSREGMGNYIGMRCLECSDGFYGGTKRCHYECGLCKDEVCSRDNCTYGCKEGYYNYQSRSCLLCFPGCETCDVWSRRDQKCETCPKGKWGRQCESRCVEGCDQGICDQDTGLCRCHDGYFMETGEKCSLCPHNCRNCSSLYSCGECMDGFYGETCEKRCASDCLTCDTEATVCTSCPSDHFMRDNRCHRCDAGCTACWWGKNSKVLECTACEEGYYSDWIEGRSFVTCYKCPTGCASCNIYGECDRCFPGFHKFLRSCCPETCIHCVTAEKCTSCIDGYFGDSCSRKCRETCTRCSNRHECDTCKPGYYSHRGNGCECSADECTLRTNVTNAPCQACKQSGWYVKGSDCCSCDQCGNGDCDRHGRCLEGCKRKGWFGVNCDLNCHQIMPGCIECVGETEQAMLCISCKQDMYLMWNKCTACPRNCLYGTCDSDGKCPSGCKANWMGEKCDVKCDNACNYVCNQYDCPECQVGYYGQRCEYACPEGCHVDANNVSVCSKLGICINCKPRLWGEWCDYVCSSGCVDGSCHMANGSCADGCHGDLFGEFCEQQPTNGGPREDAMIYLVFYLIGILLHHLLQAG